MAPDVWHMALDLCHVSSVSGVTYQVSCVTCFMLEKSNSKDTIVPESGVMCHLFGVSCQMTGVMRHASGLTWHLSQIQCHMSDIWCHVTPVNYLKGTDRANSNRKSHQLRPYVLQHCRHQLRPRRPKPNIVNNQRTATTAVLLAAFTAKAATSAGRLSTPEYP